VTNVAAAAPSDGPPAGSAPVVTVVTNVADVGVTNAGPVVVAAGTAYTNVITVTNAGPSVATNVVVVDVLPGGVTTNINVGTLPAGGVTNIYVVEVAPGVGPVTNVASAGSGTYDPNLGNNTNASVTAVTLLANVGVGKSGPGGVAAGGNIVYTVSVTNFGPSVAGGVVVTDVLAGVTFVSAGGGGVNGGGVVTWNVGALTNGQVTNVNLTVSAPANAPAGGAVTNVAAAAPSDGPPAGSAPVVTVVTNVADVGVGKSGPTGVIFNTNFSYTILVTNFGPSTATAISVTDNLPAGVVFVSSLPVATTNAGNQVIWPSVGDLAAGATTNLTLNVISTLRGMVTNFVSIGSPTLDPNPTNNVSAPVITAITNMPPIAEPDFYSISENSVTNLLLPLINDVLETPGGMLTVIGVSPTNGTAVIVGGTNVLFTPATNFTGTATIGYTITDNVGGTNSSLITITIVSLPPLANDQSVTTLENTPLAIVLAGSDPNNLPITFVIVGGPTNGASSLLNTNTGSLTYTPNVNYTGADSFTFRVNNGLTNSAVATVAISVLPAADVAIIKTGPVTGVAGSNLTYSIVATNSGPATATNVVVSDQLPAGFTFVSALPATAAVSNNVVSWPAFNLAQSARSNFTVTAVSAEGGNFTNIACSTASTLDPNTNNNNGTFTNSEVITAISPLADVAVFKTGNTNVQAGGTVTYTITATNAGPSTATNLVVRDTLPASVAFQAASGGYSLSNNVVTWTTATLAKGATATFTVAVTAPGSGTFVNVASGSSGTPDPNPTNNTSAPVTTAVVPMADVQITVFGPTNVTVGDGFFYIITVTNAGPSTAVNTLVTNILPTNLVFASASGGGLNTNNVVTWPIFPTLINGQATNLILTVTPLAGVSTNYYPTNNSFTFVETNTTPTVGFLTNRASAFATTFDPNLTNNSASSAYTNAQVQTVIVPGVFSIFIATNTYATNLPSYTQTNTVTPIGNNLFIVGTSAFNPQTGLYEEDVTVTNLGAAPVHALRLYIGGLRSGMKLYNATGTNIVNGVSVPYVEYDPPYSTPLNPYPAANSSVTFTLEFFVTDRKPFTNSLSAVAINPPLTAPVGGPVINITTNFVDYRFATSIPGDFRYVIVFNSIPGRTYTIEYSDDLVTWNLAVPSIVAAANVTQWYDDGPPETLSKPSSVSTRFYRVILQP
jgi:uncharacterized repeat protein (TIGR01451 family)